MMRPLVAKEALRDDGGITSVPDGSIVNIRELPLKLLVSHELKYTGFERPELWSQEHMFRRPDVFGYALVSKSPPTEVDEIKGWALTRRCS